MAEPESDEEWLLRHYSRATEDEIEAFAERVAIKVADGMCELTSRAEALRDVRDKKHGN